MPEVPIGELRPRCDPATFDFETTAEVSPHVGLIGQDRALEAIRFGLGVESRGFNIVVSGEPGTGRTTAIREYLQAYSAGKPPPDEWCYVNNFEDPYRPRAIRLPPGKGREFRRAMMTMIAEAKLRVPRTFASDDFVSHRDEIVASVQRHHDEVFSTLAGQARAQGFLLQGTSQGFFLVPLGADGKPMDDQAFAALSHEEREATLARRERSMEELRNAMKQEQSYDMQASERLRELQDTIATTVVASLVDPLVDAYHDFPELVHYLSEVKWEMIQHVDDFMRPADGGASPIPTPLGLREAISPFRKYEVNLLVDCTDVNCASVVFESNPTPERLFGRIEKEAVFGALTTDFTMIRAGSMHHANGGYLVFDFDDLLLYPVSWNELKRTIRTGHLTIEEMGDRMGFVETKTIRPEPIPWNGKLVGIAREQVYRLLYSLDPDFRELFKVKADFDHSIDRTPKNERAYAALIAGVTQHEGLLPLDRGAIARVVEEGIRMAEDHGKLSIRFGEITDIVRESSHWAKDAGANVITAAHIRKAIAERDDRVNLIEDNLLDAMERGIIVVDTSGSVTGQVNGLSVVDLGDTAFGHPARITASIGVGREGVIDLQRESHLSGPIFSKAVLTLQGFLVDRYASEEPLTLAARLAFEQSYGLIEGDSATAAETCALLSRIAGVPVKQALAITGSMDQLGEVQAIGGVNQKIEGFFDVCRVRGLTGDQGVIIPATNVQHLMLREDVVKAVQEGKFAVHAVSTVDEAIELLTGLEAGAKGEDGHYPPDSVNGRVASRLHQIADQMRKASIHDDDQHQRLNGEASKPDTSNDAK
ncbi:MAG TPA: AAA family ATPase [Dehalococcoidia bacterium]|nr:AAA family ATPase [Dehalococcoidia bacterium]